MLTEICDRVERAGFDRVHGVIGIDAASDEARLSAFARFVQDLDHAAILQSRERRAMKLHHVDVVGAQIFETAFDTPR